MKVPRHSHNDAFPALNEEACPRCCLNAQAPELLAALQDLRYAATDAYKAGRVPAEPFIRAGNVLAKARRRG